MDLGFFAADTLGVTLYQVKGKLRSSEVHQIRLGPWKIDMPVEVESDVLGATELGFWVTLGKHLRLYAIVKEKENWLFVLDEAKLKAVGAETAFAATSVKGRVLEIKPAIQGVFQWKGSDWKQVGYAGDFAMG